MIAHHRFTDAATGHTWHLHCATVAAPRIGQLFRLLGRVEAFRVHSLPAPGVVVGRSATHATTARTCDVLWFEGPIAP